MMLRKYSVARMALAGTVDTLDGVGDPGSWADSVWNFIYHYRPGFIRDRESYY
jgi:hypothetical protein